MTSNRKPTGRRCHFMMNQGGEAFVYPLAFHQAMQTGVEEGTTSMASMNVLCYEC